MSPVVSPRYTVAARPFIRWAGGKTQLLEELMKHVPKRFGHYYEPFIGGGALYFALAPRHATLSDSNRKLIDVYRVLREDPEALIRALAAHERRYYARRDSQEAREAYYMSMRRLLHTDVNAGDRIEQAALFVFLNKTNFNGLYRVNKKGRFNVPHGKFKKLPTICDADNLRACARVLRERATILCAGDFHWALHTMLGKPQKGDFVYLDPPYWPASESSDFTSYTKDGFGSEQQEQLADVAAELRERGVTVVLSNADVKPVRKLYTRRGFELREVSARRSINSKTHRRGKVGELIIY